MHTRRIKLRNSGSIFQRGRNHTWKNSYRCALHSVVQLLDVTLVYVKDLAARGADQFLKAGCYPLLYMYCTKCLNTKCVKVILCYVWHKKPWGHYNIAQSDLLFTSHKAEVFLFFLVRDGGRSANCNRNEIKNNFYCSLVRMVSAHSEGVQQGVESITYQQPNRHHIFLSSLQKKLCLNIKCIEFGHDIAKYRMHAYHGSVCCTHVRAGIQLAQIY